MKEMSLRDTQEKTLEVLMEFDKLCKSLGVTYYLVWGTLIGAIRHKGFIPWDDDLDVAMFPDDYEMIYSYLKENDDKLEIHNMETCQECFYNISRVCDKTHLLKFTNKKYTSGLFIDIYVMHGLGNTEDLGYWRKRFEKYPKWRRAINICASTTLLIGKNPLIKILNLPLVVFTKAIGKDYFVKKFNDFRKFDIDKSEFLGLPQWEEVIFEKKDFAEVKYVQFEGFMAPIPIGYDNFLKSYYGDYMILPPESGRHPSHGYKAYEK